MRQSGAVLLGSAALALGVLLGWRVAHGLGAPLSPFVLFVLVPGCLLVYRHHEIWVWRRPSVVVFAAVCSGGWAWMLGSSLEALVGSDVPAPALSAAGPHTPIVPWGLTAGLAAFVAPWPGHLLGLLLRRWPRRPLAVSARGRRRHRVEQALGRSLFWRLSGRPGAPTGQIHEKGVHDIAAWLETPHGPIPLQPEGPDKGMARAVKRTLDLAIVALAAPVALPLVPFLALVVKIQDGGAPFYSQERVTEGSKSFVIHKIRSMVSGAEPGGKPIWPAEHDPRITAAGRFLRRFWLDELPQLWDVLRGSLSAVGPRPERPFFVQEFERDLPNYPLRHQVRAGITGLAQISGYVGNTSIGRRLHLDLRYARRWTPLMDLGIIAGTVLRMFRRPPIEAREG